MFLAEAAWRVVTSRECTKLSSAFRRNQKSRSAACEQPAGSSPSAGHVPASAETVTQEPLLLPLFSAAVNMQQHEACEKAGKDFIDKCEGQVDSRRAPL